MQYEPLTRQSVRRFLPRFLPHDGKVFQAAPHDGPLLEWSSAEDGAELLGCNGTPLVHIRCRDRRWFFSLIGSNAAPIRSGSRAEARLLAECYARRTLRA
ncbi:hypothetical protein [Xanthobacter autotrophicus]|uniref:hypothetical protein n=1 Tax=Xanthobacter autotrophicus TaxID=280 RepID=UPI003728186C